MPIEMPPVRTGNLNEDVDKLWEWAWKLTERLNLSEEALARKGARDDLSKT